jgi:hypothetical protein
MVVTQLKAEQHIRQYFEGFTNDTKRWNPETAYDVRFRDSITSNQRTLVGRHRTMYN